MFAVIVVAFIIACFFAWFFTQKSKEDERHLLIEKGYSPSELPDRRSFNISFPWLKIGSVVTTASFGAVLGFFAVEYLNHIERDAAAGPAFLICVLLFGGIGMIIAHYIDKPNDNS